MFIPCHKTAIFSEKACAKYWASLLLEAVRTMAATAFAAISTPPQKSSGKNHSPVLQVVIWLPIVLSTLTVTVLVARLKLHATF